ncbi:MAG: hypothetical protein J7M38_09010 [Armatimonadetes bacterium]|nr:hypothetical protein [Armatimonadota bacterium]
MKAREDIRMGTLAVCFMAALGHLPAYAIGPVNTAVVVNADSWASMTVANEYIHLRQIPERNVVYLEGLRDFEFASVDDFRELILRPTLRALEQRGVADHIDCIAWSSDIPSRINVRADMKGHEFPKIITPMAALNGLTFLYARVLGDAPGYLKLDANRYARLPEPMLDAQPLAAEFEDAYVAALKLMEDEKYPEAAEALLPIAERAEHTPEVLYNTACALARAERFDEAMTMLQRAVDAGLLNFAQVTRDRDLEKLRVREDFKALIERMKARRFDVQPTRAFRNRYGWNEDGEPGSDGEHYLLSTMLGWTSGRGNSVAEVIECLRRSVAADGSRPPGAIYYMVNRNIRSQTRLWGFATAIGMLEEMGVAAEAVDGTLPQDRDDVAGLMAGSATLDWGKSGSTLLPGAIAEHLTSCGGMVHAGASQTPITHFIRHGAAGSSGTVTEPYAIQAKFPDPFLHVHYARGCTLAEAFYQSVRGPYQLLIIGDPLCRPWARPPEIVIEGISEGQAITGTVNISAHTNDERPVKQWELYGDGLLLGRAPALQNMSLDLSGLSDGWHELRVVAVLDDLIETQAERAIPFVMVARGRTIHLTPPVDREPPFGATVHIGASMAGAERIVFACNGHIVADIQGAEGAAEIDTAKLGLGPVTIASRAFLADGSTVAGKPIRLTVVLPAPMPARSEPQAPAEGLLMSVPGAEPVVIESTRNRKWLEEAGIEPGREIALSAYFSVDADDMYQFQTRCDGPTRIMVDGVEVVGLTGGEGWRITPLCLAAGAHELEVTATVGPTRLLQIRFGGPGCLSVGKPRFGHAADD